MFECGGLDGAAAILAWIVERLLWLFSGVLIGVGAEWQWGLFERAMRWIASWMEARGWMRSGGSGPG